MKVRRDEGKAMYKKMYKNSYGGDRGMSYRHKIPAHVHNVKGHLSSLIKK